MSLESRIEAVGRWVLRSPLWTGLAVTLFFVLPTAVIPGIPLWVSATIAVVVGPPIVVMFYILYGIYGRLFGSTDDSKPATASEAESTDSKTPVERLKRRYADGEIDEETFERRLEQLMQTEELSADLTEPNRAEMELQG